MTKFTKLPKEQWFNEDIPSDSRQIDELRRLVRDAGYPSLRLLNEQRAKQQNKQKEAGKKSAAARAPRAQARLHIVKLIYDRLDHKFKCRPYSKEAIDALYEEYHFVMRRPDHFYWYDHPTIGDRCPPTEDEPKYLVSDLPKHDYLLVGRYLFDKVMVGLGSPPNDLAEDHPFWFLLGHAKALKVLKSGAIDLSSLKVPVPPKVASFVAEFELSKLIRNAMSELSDADQKALQQVSRETLIKDLKSLRVRGHSRTGRSG
jgi:hypothetical protein